MSREPEHIPGYGDVFTLQRAVAVCCDAAGVSVDDLRVPDKSVAYDAPKRRNTPRAQTLAHGFTIVQRVCVELIPAWSVLSPAWKLTGTQLDAISKKEWRSLDLYERWRAGDDASDEDKVLVLKVGFVQELAKRFRILPPRERPPWQNVATSLFETIGKCSLIDLKTEWCRVSDEWPADCEDKQGRPCLKFGDDTPPKNSVNTWLKRQRKRPW